MRESRRPTMTMTMTMTKFRRVNRRFRLIVIGAVFFGASVSFADSPPPSSSHADLGPGYHLGEPRKGWSFEALARTPILNGGRLKPMDAFATDAVLFVTGSRQYQGWRNLDLLLSWMSAPHLWESQSIFKISAPDVRKQLLLPADRTRFSANELFHNPQMKQYWESLYQRFEGKEGAKMSPSDQALKRVFDQITFFLNIQTGLAWSLIPTPPPNAWDSLEKPRSDEAGKKIRSLFGELVRAYYEGNQSQFERFSEIFRQTVEGAIQNYGAQEKSHVELEYLYYRLDLFTWAWIIYLAAALTWTASFVASSRLKKKFQMPAAALTVTAFLIHILGFIFRCKIAGRPPVTNMYESVIWVSLGAMLFGFIVYWRRKDSIVLCVATYLSAFGLIAGNSAPAIMDPAIHPLVPVLRSNYWLTIHVLTITLGYAAFALTMGLGNVALYHFLRSVPKQDAAQKVQRLQRAQALNDLVYRAMQFGVVLLAAGTILGGVWADYSWGRFWGWDPKEVWALIALLVYLAILHGRFAGWVGPFGYSALTVLGFSSVVMAWYGVNFVLGAGLHSYGFSSGGGWPVGLGLAIQLGFVVLCAVLFQSQKRLRSKKA